MIKLGPNLKLQLKMFLVEDLFFLSAVENNPSEVSLRIRIEIEKTSDRYDKLADLNITLRGIGGANFDTKMIVNRVYECTQVIDFGFSQSLLQVNS